MSFHEVDWPYNPDAGIQGGPRIDAGVIQLGNGQVEIVQRWETEGNVYNAAYAVRSTDDVSGMLRFWRARGGVANGFRFKDWLDFTTAEDGTSDPTDEDAIIGIGDGTTTIFQLKKTYIDALHTYERTLRKIVPGTTVVSLDEVSTPSGWSVNTATGEILFSTAPSSSVVVRAGCEFRVPCRFDIGAQEAILASFDAVTTGGIPIVPIVEMKNPSDVQDTWYPGGSDEIDLEADYTLSMLNGRVVVFTNTTTSIWDVNLPGPDTLPDGNDIWVVVNSASSIQNFPLKDQAGTTLATLTPGDRASVSLSKNSSGNGTYRVHT